jgi:hypothetical protein
LTRSGCCCIFFFYLYMFTRETFFSHLSSWYSGPPRTH